MQALLYLVILVIIIGFIGTIFAVREVNQKLRQEDKNLSQAELELQRSNQYEKSVNKYWGRLSYIYLITFILAIIVLFVFLLKKYI